jgi:soluble lytic murein transglycosylase-like protein
MSMISSKTGMTGVRMRRRLVFIALMILICVSGGFAQRRKSSRAHGKRHSPPSAITLKQGEEILTSGQVRLDLIDGSVTILDDARESEQGFWYERKGVTYLIPRERVKTSVRPQVPKLTTEAAVPRATIATAVESPAAVRPVWIYLVGGARVEADSVNESTAGVWYKRGPLAVFIERNRVERIEREDSATAAEADAVIRERGWTTGNAGIDTLIKQNGAKHGVDPYLIFCVMEQESHFSTRAVSPKGARGLMQLMPGTSARFGVRHPHNPGENISAGARYLKQLLDQFNGRVDLVLAGYNAGEGTVIRYGHKVPPFRETRDYVRRISSRYHRAKAPMRAGLTRATTAPPALGF